MTERKRNRQVRQSQTIAPFGAGNIYDFLGESFVACDTLRWKHHGDPVASPRLARALHVEGFRSAPVQWDSFGRSAPGVPYFRFPQWLFCQTCRRVTRWRASQEVPDEPARCAHCRGAPQLVPMRFVMACEDGHLGDVPWDRWTHFGSDAPEQRTCQAPDLRFETVRGAGAGLESLRLRCTTCKAERSLKGITKKQRQGTGGAVRGLKCPGKQPWESHDERIDCGRTPEILQRGASNLYFGSVVSAIDIPPHSNFSAYGDLTLKITGDDLFRVLTSFPEGALKEQLIGTLAVKVGCSPDAVRGVLSRETEARAGSGAHAVAHAPPDLETEEWHALITPREDQDERDDFITRHTLLLDDPTKGELPRAMGALVGLIDKVVLVTKLREVRALAYFSRILPEQTKIRPGLRHDVNWLPAIQVFGEGIFFSLDEDALRVWEASDGIRRAAAELEQRRAQSLMAGRLRKSASPRFLLLHSFAHLLIRQLTFECGYSSSSLRERIYARTPEEGDPQAGVLIYTAAGDVEGTLGGLVRQGEPPRLIQTMLAALERASWCSADPICRESKAQGFQGLNRGACHACSLVAETSCDFSNALLDRSFVVGGIGVEGYFQRVLRSATEDTLRVRGDL